MSKISRDEALKIAKETCKDKLDEGVFKSVDVEELSSGYKVKIQVEQAPLIGLGSMFITNNGEVKSYPSNMSPSQAQEVFLAGE